MFEVVIKTNETWLICGGRDFADQAMFDDVMGRLMGMWGCPSKVVHGKCPTGADQMADVWGNRMAIDVVPCPADWQRHGKSAGPIRNFDMLKDHKPRRVIAFPGGAGTEDMIRQSKIHRDIDRELVDVVEIQPVAVQ
jgi:hypothetical protein